MALAAATVFEVRTTGSDTNGGGFVTGASGTDWSQQDSPQYLVTDGVTAGTTTITSATANFGTDVVGNIMYVQGGTGSVTAGWYQITARTNTTTITVDRSTGLTAGTGVTLKIGGAFASIGTAVTLMTVNGMLCYIKATADYSIGTGITTSATPGFTGPLLQLIGYTTTRGDGGQATIKATAAITCLTTGGSDFRFNNLIFDGNSATGTTGVAFSSNYGNSMYNCIVKNFSGSGVTSSSGQPILIKCSVTGCAGANGAIYHSNTNFPIFLLGCSVYSNTTIGVQISGVLGNVIENCIIANNSGSTSDGLRLGTNVFISFFRNNVIYGNGRDGIQYTSYYIPGIVAGNIFVNNGRYGLNGASGTSAGSADPQINWNAFYNNTSGARNLFNAGANDVTLTADPFVAAGSNNFALNNIQGAGAACRAAGFPGAYIVGGTAYADIGALQSRVPWQTSGLQGGLNG